MENKIPQVIHYCWFWKWKKSADIEKCINSWKIYCPNYKIIEWNESNFDINLNYYTKTFYNKRKWAFVADYARLHILYNHWWVYFDTDVEVIKNFDDLLENEAFTGFQDRFNIWWSIIWSKIGNPILKDTLDYYETKKMRIILPNLLNKIFKNYTSIKYKEELIKLKDFSIYPKDFFYPYAYFERPDSIKITKNTHTIHHYDATWLPKIVRVVCFPIIWFVAKYL